MKCTYCISKGCPSSFVDGCTSCKLDSIVKHEKSAANLKAVSVEKARPEPSSSSVAAKTLQKLNAAVFEKLSHIFRTCNALVMNNHPITDFNWICDLDEAKGLHIGETYRNNNKSPLTFIQAIADTQFKKSTDAIPCINRTNREGFRGFQNDTKFIDWATANGVFGNRFPNILGLADLALTMSPTSSEAERGFSQLKLIKTRLRTKLCQSSLNDLLAIKLGAPSIKAFNPTEAINLCINRGQRSRGSNVMDNKKSEAPLANVADSDAVTSVSMESHDTGYRHCSMKTILHKTVTPITNQTVKNIRNVPF
ncbi:hypothetical protein ACF0H5_018402 [Mactra antiquata]